LKKLELFLNDDIWKKLQQVASVKGISLEGVANKVIKNYVGFSGRARRKEYWMFALINIVISVVLSLLGKIDGIGSLFTALGGLYSLGLLLPSIAVGIRRLHDIGKSGFWLLISLIPLAGAIWLIVLFAKEGTPGSNSYGSDPKEEIV